MMMKPLINIIKIIHRLLYSLLVPIIIILFIISHILYQIIMIPVPIIIYIIKGVFNTDYVYNIDYDDHIINKIFEKINNFIRPNYK